MTLERFREAAMSAMRAQRITTKDLARRLGVSRQWVHRVVLDPRNPGANSKTIDAVCRELGITIDFTRGEK